MDFNGYTLLVVLLWGRTSCKNLHVGIMGTNYSNNDRFMLFEYIYIGAAVPLAFDTAKFKLALLKNYTVDFTYSVSQCNERRALDVFIKLKQDHNVDVVLGPQCSSECVPTALLASQWNIPMISHTCSTKTLSDSMRFNTFMRTTGSNSIGDAVAAALRNFNWAVVALIQPSYAGYRIHDANSIKTACASTNISISKLIDVGALDDPVYVLHEVIPKARGESFLKVLLLFLNSIIEDIRFFQVVHENPFKAATNLGVKTEKR